MKFFRGNKKKALELINQMGLTWNLTNDKDPSIEVFAPDGYWFVPDQFFSFLCDNWDDVIEDLSSSELEPCDPADICPDCADWKEVLRGERKDESEGG